MAKSPLQAAAAHGHSHEVPFGKLVITLIWLMAFMGLTIFASQNEVPTLLGIKGIYINNIIALAIAVVKACLVIWIFMGVMYASQLTRIWVAAGFLVLILLFGILGDYATRRFEPVQGWDPKGESALQRQWPPNPPPVPNNENLRPRL